MPDQNKAELPVADSLLTALKRCFQGSRGLESLEHAPANLLWKAGIVLLFAAMGLSIVGSFGIQVFFPDFGARMGVVTMPMAWVFVAMPLLLLVQIIGGKRGLEAERLFLTAALSAFAFFLFFAPFLLLVPYLPENPALAIIGLLFVLVGNGWAAIQMQKGLVQLLGVADNFAGIKAPGVSALAFFAAVGIWLWLFKDAATWDATFFLG